jgi:hypothetical protein
MTVVCNLDRGWGTSDGDRNGNKYFLPKRTLMAGKPRGYWVLINYTRPVIRVLLYIKYIFCAPGVCNWKAACQACHVF